MLIFHGIFLFFFKGNFSLQIFLVSKKELYTYIHLDYYKLEFYLSVRLDSLFFVSLFYYSAYFCYYLEAPLHFLVLFMGLTILFQLTFTFIYSTLNKKFSVSVK